MHFASARNKKRARECVDCRAGRDDVVDDQHVLAVERAVHQKRVRNVASAIRRGERGLRQRRHSHHAARDQRQAQRASERPGDLRGLVVTTFAQTPRMQRHGHDSGPPIAVFRQVLEEQQTKGTAERPGMAKLERMNDAVDGGAEAPRREDGRDPPTETAAGTVADWTRKSAPCARRRHARKSRAAGAAIPGRRRPAAAGAAFGKQRFE
jgi:hypothetical protein